MNAAQRLWESLGLPTTASKAPYQPPTKYANAKRRHWRRPGNQEAAPAERYGSALTHASKKYDLPRPLKPRSCDGTRESRRQLEQRMNWLRNRAAEEGA